MRAAQLLGREQHTVGALAAVSEGPAAIALSRGGFAKQYDHTEPNEDAALFAYDVGGALIAVADGHHGAAGSQAVVAHLEAEWAPRWTAPALDVADAEAWHHESARALGAANHALLRDAAERGLPPAPTTLALALVRPAERRVLWAGIGDSHVFAVFADRATDWLGEAMSGRRAAFLGYESRSAESLTRAVAAGVADLSALGAVVLATDGLSESAIGVADPADAVAAAFSASASAAHDRRPLELARRVSHAAMAAHRENRAGDNIASAVVWTASEPGRPGR